MLDEHCGPLEMANGHCGCESGLSCQWVPSGTASSSADSGNLGTLGKRSMVYHPEPGNYQCAPKA